MSYMKRSLEDECDKIAKETGADWMLVMDIYGDYCPPNYFIWKSLVECELKHRRAQA